MQTFPLLILAPVSLCLLAACTQQENTPAPASSAPRASAALQTPPASAPQAPAPSSASAASATQSADGSLPEMGKAKWQPYRCEQNAEIEVRYYKTAAGEAAQIRFQGKVLTAAYSPGHSDEDLSAFSNGEYTWTIGNQFENDYYKEANGFLVRHEAQEVNGENTVTDELLTENCTPAA